jgi:hypothetical protein
MEDKNIEANLEIEEEIKGCAWNPEDGIVLEWWGRAEGLSDEQ